MAEKVISATLKVNTGTSATDIGNVNKALDNTSKELGDVEKDSKSTQSSFTNLKGSLDKIPGPLGAVNQGVNTVSTSLKALAANPIVLVVTLLVAALVALYKAFASTEAGAEKIEQIMSGLGAVITVIRDRILQLAGAVVSFFKGDFTAAAEQAKAAVTGVGDAAVAAYNRAAQAQKDLQEATDNYNRSILVSRAQLNADLAKSKELISDETASYKDRKKAVDEVSAAQEIQAKKEVDHFRELERIAKDNADRDKNNADYQDELSKATIDRINAEQQASQDARNINKQAAQIEQQQKAKADEQSKAYHEAEMKRLAEEKAALEERNKQHKEFIKFLYDGTNISQQLAEDAAAAQKAQDEADKAAAAEKDAWQSKLLAKQTTGLLNWVKTNKDAADEQYKNEKALADFRIQTAQNVGNALSALGDLIGRQTIAGKALAIAQATINTWLGVTQVLANKTVLPEPLGTINKIASVVAVVAAGLGAVKNIVKTNPGSSGGGGDAGSLSVSAPSTSAPIAPQQQNTAIDQNSIDGFGNAVSGRTYVLSQDVSHDQDRNERLNRSARLGG